MDIFTSDELLSAEVPDDVGPGPGVVDDALELDLLLLAHLQLRPRAVTHQLRGRRRQQHVQLGAGADGLVGAVRADLATSSWSSSSSSWSLSSSS